MTKTHGTTAGMKNRGAHIHDMTRKNNVTIPPTNGLKPGLQKAGPAPKMPAQGIAQPGFNKK
jgi:hypothetical protein